MRDPNPEKRGKRTRVEFGAISIPMPVLEEIDKLIKEYGYWPSRSSFAREACIEKIERERLKKIKEK
ncbi:MAG: ribbon-helix-helix domain-containing protein [Candidatus Bathyarchaeia archaeon]